MDLKNKIAIVAGASGGIGSEITKALAKEGILLGLVARNTRILKSLAQEAQKLGSPKALFYECDLKNPEEIKKITQKIIGDFGRVDILFNAAGIGVYKTLEETSLEEWNDSFSINVTAAFLVTKYLLPALEKSEKGVVISMGSGMGTIPKGDRLAYCTSKFALRGMSLSLSDEFKNSNPTICLITLGSTLTKFGPMTIEEKKQENLQGKPYFTPEWVAQKLVDILKNDEIKDEIVLYPSEYENSN